MADELKPCPFCGGHAQTDFIEGESYIIECYGCDARTGHMDSAQGAIEAWNRRATPSAEVSDEELPPLPKCDASYSGGRFYSEDTMHAYARSAIAADRQKRGA